MRFRTSLSTGFVVFCVFWMLQYCSVNFTTKEQLKLVHESWWVNKTLWSYCWKIWLSQKMSRKYSYVSRNSAAWKNRKLGGIGVAFSHARAWLSYMRRVRLSVRLSHAGIGSKPMTLGSFSFYHLVAQGLSDTNFHTLCRRGTRSLAMASNETGVDENDEKCIITSLLFWSLIQSPGDLTKVTSVTVNVFFVCQICSIYDVWSQSQLSDVLCEQ